MKPVNWTKRNVWPHLVVFYRSFIDFDVKPKSVKQLKKARLVESFRAIVNFVWIVGVVSNAVYRWTIPVAAIFFSTVVRRTMRALSAHKQIPIQTVQEVMGA